jgi:hypothetical protein
MAALAVELIWGEKPVTIGEVAQFLAQARAIGADDETQLEAAIERADNEVEDHDTQVGWRLALESGVRLPVAEVRLEAAMARSLLELLNLLAESDGDVRALEGSIAEVRDGLLRALLRPTLGDDDSSS